MGQMNIAEEGISTDGVLVVGGAFTERFIFIFFSIAHWKSLIYWDISNNVCFLSQGFSIKNSA